MHLSSSPISYGAAFVGGLILSFTPCVYPLIPIISGYISGRAGNSKRKGFFLSLTYASGLAVAYAALGLFASLGGKIFGTLSAHPLTHILAGSMIILFGVSLFDVFKINFAAFLNIRAVYKGSYFSAFLLGMTSSLLISPCVTPVLGAILLYLAAQKNIFYGTTILLAFALGMSLILVLAGTFSSFLLGLPKPGKWMVYAKRFSALVLLGMGAYFIWSGISGL